LSDLRWCALHSRQRLTCSSLRWQSPSSCEVWCSRSSRQQSLSSFPPTLFLGTGRPRLE
jgi:hypothetical protein